MDNIANIYICNKCKLMSDYLINLTKVRGSTSNNILQGCGTIKLRLTKKNGNKNLIPNL